MALKFFAIIALLIVLAKESSALTCDLSFNGTCYRYVSSYQTWTVAERNCITWGGHLVSIHSKEENAQVNSLSRGRSVWIGMSDRAKEDVWKWSDGSANTYHQFTRYPPYDCYNNQDCAYLIYYGRYYWYGNYGYWNDYYCWGRLPSICGQLVPIPSEARGLTLVSATSTSLTIKWEAPITHYNSINQYTVSIMGQELDTVMRNITVVTDSLSDQTLTMYQLKEANKYTISVYAHTHGGPARAITVMNIMTLEDIPSTPPTIEGAYSSTPTEIQLTWSALPSAESNGILTNYTISYTGSLLDTNTRVVVRDASLPRMLTLSGLEEYTQYIIRISASTQIGTGPVGTSFVTTAADAPSAPVTNHIVTTLTSTQLFVSWGPPALPDRNGVLSYKISYRSSGATSYTTAGVTSMLSSTLSGLQEAVTYEIRVTAVSIGMEGPESVVNGTTLMDVPAMSAQNFALSISTTTSITVAWNPPNAEDQNGVLTSYVLVYAGTELDQQERMVTLYTSASGFTTSYTAQNLEEDNSYSFSIIAYTSIGSGPSMTITGLKTQQDVPSGTPNDVSVAAVSPNSVRVSFSPIELIDRNGPISHFTVYYSGTRLQPEQKTIIVVATGWEQLIEGLEEDSEYSVSVSASTLVGEGPTSTVIKVTTFTSAPSAAVTNLNATTLSPASIEVEWDELPYEHRNGELTGYEVMYWRNAEDSRIHTVLVPSLAEMGRVSVELYRLQPYTSYRIQVSAANADGTGDITDIPSMYTHEDFPIIEISSTAGSSPDPHSARLTWTKPNCNNETQVSNTKYNLTYHYTDHSSVEHTHSIVTPDNFLAVESLLPYTEYTFYVSSFTGAGTGSVGPEESVRTQIKAPSTPPSSVTLQAINCSTIQVTCMPPAPEHQNGPLHSYSIFYQGNQFDRAMREVVYELTDQSYPDTTTRDFYLNELMEYEQYTVMVRVSTNAGYSEYTAAIHARTTEAAPTDTPQDIMSMSTNSTCVQVVWNPPPVTSQRGAITQYTIMYQGVERDTTEQTVMIQVSPVFPDMRHQSYILCGLMEDTSYLVRVQCDNTAGSSEYSLAATVMTQEAAPSAPPTNLMHTSHTPYITTLTWVAPGEHEQNGIIRYYNLDLTEEGMSTPAMIMAPSLSYNLSPLKAYTSYTVAVAAVTAEGEGPSATLMFTTPQDVPSHGVSSLMLTGRTSTSLSLSWSAPTPSQRRGVLVEYTVQWYGFRIDTNIHSTSVTLGDLDMVREYTIDGLEEATNYTVEVTVVGEEGNGPSVRLTHICTSPTAPSSPVLSLQLVSVTSRYCIISWMEPPLSQHNGPLEDYKISINSSMGTMEYTSMRTSYRIEDLNEHTMYSVSVASTNSEGEGPVATISFTTLKNVPSGAPLNFRVSDISTTSLTAHWSPPALADRNGILQEYLLSYMGEMSDTSMRSVRVSVAAGEEESDQTYLLEGLEEYTSYSLELSVLNDKGESPVSRLQNVKTLPTVPSSPVSSLALESVSPRSALISWKSPAASSLNGAGVHFRVHVSAGSLGRNRRDSEGTEMTTDGQHVMLSDLSPNSVYSVSVQPANSEGMGPASMLDVNTMEDVPTAAVQNVIVSDVSSTGLTVSWEAPPLSHQNGPITVYSILISAVNSSYSRSVTSLALTVDITGLHPNYEYTVSVTAESNSGSGIASSPIMFTTLQAPPSAPVSDFNLIRINTTTVLMTWSPLARDLQNGEITHYSLSYSSHSLMETFSLTTDQFFFYINSLNSTDGYTFKLTAQNSMGAGPIVVETVTQNPEIPAQFKFTEKEMSFTFSGILLLGVVLLLILLIVVCLAVCMSRRRSKKNSARTEERLALRDLEDPSNRIDTVYTGMDPVKDKGHTYANFNKVGKEGRTSIFNAELPEIPMDIPLKSEDIYATPHDQTTYVNKACEAETYGNASVLKDIEEKDCTDA